MSRDESLKDKFALLRAAHRERDARHHGGGAEGEEAHHEALLELKRLHDEHHRQRDEKQRLREEERARRKGKRPLNAEAIAAAAVAIADAQGVEEVSMRKIAAVLGAGTMSLYHYVRTKEDLLAAMEDLIMGEILVPQQALKGGWRKAMGAIARHTRDAYSRHPWALLVSGNGKPGLNSLKHVEQSIAALETTGLSFEDRLVMSVIVDDFVFGNSLRAAQARLEEQQAGASLDDVTAFMTKHVDPIEFPVLHAAVGDSDMGDFIKKMAVAFQPGEWFDTGLEALLDGLAKRFGLGD